MAFTQSQLTAFFTNAPQMGLTTVARMRLAEEGLETQGRREYLERKMTGCHFSPGGGPEGGNTMLPTGGQVRGSGSFLCVFNQRIAQFRRP